MDNKLRWLIRCGYIGWLTFEVLNLINVLHFSLDFSWVGLMVTSSGIWIAMEIVSYRLKKSGLEALPWGAYLTGLVGTTWDALGDVAHLYSRITWYDQAAHFLGGGAAAVVFFFLIWRVRQAGRISMGHRLLGFFAICASAFIGMLYELEEYAETVIFHNNRLGDALDTPNDMLWNTIGALVFIYIAIKIVNRLNKVRPKE